MTRSLTATGVMVFLSFACICQPVLAQSPEDVARKYFQALQAEGLSASARFMHPDALADFKSMLLPVFEAEAASGSRDFTRNLFGPEASIETVREIAPAEFMTTLFRLLEMQPGAAQMRFDKLEMLGSVSEKEARHVLARLTIGAGEFSVEQMEVLSLIPFEDTWRLQLNGQMKGLASAMRAGAASR